MAEDLIAEPKLQKPKDESRFSLKEKIEMYLREKPELTPQEIAEECDCTPQYVYKVRGRMEKEAKPEAKPLEVEVEPKPKVVEEPEEDFEIPEEFLDEEEDEEEEEAEEEEPEDIKRLEEEGKIPPKPEVRWEDAKPLKPEEFQLTKDEVQHIVELPFELAGEFTGCEKLKLSPKTSKILTESTKRMFDIYMPIWLKQHGAPVFCGLIWLSVVAYKISIYKRWKKDQEPSLPKEEPAFEPEPKEEPKRELTLKDLADLVKQQEARVEMIANNNKAKPVLKKGDTKPKWSGRRI